jgi:hypothetical protein
MVFVNVICENELCKKGALSRDHLDNGEGARRATARNSLVFCYTVTQSHIIPCHSPSINLNMFCERCQDFWTIVISKADVPDVVESCKDIHWAAHETTLHRSIRELKRASELCCRLCRIIYSTPTAHEHETLLKYQDEPIDIVLNINTNNGPLPTLSAEFREIGNTGVRIPKRMIASCSGLLNDGKSSVLLKKALQLMPLQKILRQL